MRHVARYTSWSLVALGYGFFLLGVSINIWNAWSAGNIADTALLAAKRVSIGLCYGRKQLG